MRRTIVAATVAASLAGGAGAALAHGTVAVDGWYGGQIKQGADGLRVEFAVRDGALRAWVRDPADKPVTAAGEAEVLVGDRTAHVVFKPEGKGLVAELPVAAADKVVAVLSLTVAGKPLPLRFAQEAVAEPALVDAARAGKPVFERVCATCHGAALRGTDKGPPLLHILYTAAAGHTDPVMASAMGRGTRSHMWKLGDMPMPDGLAPGDDKALVAYIRAMQAANGLGSDAHVPAGSRMDPSAHLRHHH
jgi:mono/diheme cytochrome c family protein